MAPPRSAGAGPGAAGAAAGDTSGEDTEASSDSTAEGETGHEPRASQHLQLLRRKYPALLRPRLGAGPLTDFEKLRPMSAGQRGKQPQPQGTQQLLAQVLATPRGKQPPQQAAPSDFVAAAAGARGEKEAWAGDFQDDGGQDNEVVSTLLQALVDPALQISARSGDRDRDPPRGREPCPTCGRLFAPEAAQRHFPICQKATGTRKKRISDPVDAHAAAALLARAPAPPAAAEPCGRSPFGPAPVSRLRPLGSPLGGSTFARAGNSVLLAGLTPRQTPRLGGGSGGIEGEMRGPFGLGFSSEVLSAR